MTDFIQFAHRFAEESNAVGLILCCWVAASIALAGIGALLRMPFHLPEADLDDSFLSFWLGFATVLFFLELWHLFYPVNATAALLVSVSGVAGHVVTRACTLRAIFRAASRLSRGFLCFLALAAVWIANCATAAPDFFDSGNYHFPVIRWVTSFPIVRGLGNIDGHLAFNNVSLLYQGLFEFGFLRHRSAHFGNGVLLLCVFAFFVFTVREGFAKRHFSPSALVALVLLIPLVFFIPDVSTPNTDLPSTILLFVIAYCLTEFVSLLNDPAIATPAMAFRLFVAGALCAIAPSVKLSAGFFSGAACVAFLWMWLAAPRAPRKYRLKIAGVVLGTVAGAFALWSYRSVLLSGYPLFPSLAFRAPVPWRIPEFYAEWYSWWIRTFARVPYLESISADGLAWIPSWFSTEFRSAKIEGILPVLLTVFSLSYATNRVMKEGRGIPFAQLAPWLPALLSIPLWFLSAPSFRFGAALLWIMAAQTAAFALQYVLKNRAERIPSVLRVLCWMPLIAIPMQIWSVHRTQNRSLPDSLARALWVPPGADDGFQPAYQDAFEKVVNQNGVVIFRPAYKACTPEHWRDCVMWYGPVPGTVWQGALSGASIREQLAYLTPPDPAGGFAVHDSRALWLSRHATDVRKMARDAPMNLRQLTRYFEVGPDVIREALRGGME